jgi:hypothetical protein
MLGMYEATAFSARMPLIPPSSQHDQSPLNIGQDLRLKAGTNFLQHENAPGPFVGRNPPVRHASVNAAHFAAAPRAAC